jgi:hypothetical protein
VRAVEPRAIPRLEQLTAHIAQLALKAIYDALQLYELLAVLEEQNCEDDEGEPDHGHLRVDAGRDPRDSTGLIRLHP